jgi:hypothetical protein
VGKETSAEFGGVQGWDTRSRVQLRRFSASQKPSRRQCDWNWTSIASVCTDGSSSSRPTDSFRPENDVAFMTGEKMTEGTTSFLVLGQPISPLAAKSHNITAKSSYEGILTEAEIPDTRTREAVSNAAGSGIHRYRSQILVILGAAQRARKKRSNEKNGSIETWQSRNAISLKE